MSSLMQPCPLGAAGGVCPTLYMLPGYAASQGTSPSTQHSWGLQVLWHYIDKHLLLLQAAAACPLMVARSVVGVWLEV